MAKAVLEFNLEDQGDRDFYRDAIVSQVFRWVIQEYDNQLRAIVKYSEGEHEEYYEAIDRARELLYDCLRKVGVDLFD